MHLIQQSTYIKKICIISTLSVTGSCFRKSLIRTKNCTTICHHSFWHFLSQRYVCTWWSCCVCTRNTNSQHILKDVWAAMCFLIVRILLFCCVLMRKFLSSSRSLFAGPLEFPQENYPIPYHLYWRKDVSHLKVLDACLLIRIQSTWLTDLWQ